MVQGVEWDAQGQSWSLTDSRLFRLQQNQSCAHDRLGEAKKQQKRRLQCFSPKIYAASVGMLTD